MRFDRRFFVVLAIVVTFVLTALFATRLAAQTALYQQDGRLTYAMASQNAVGSSAPVNVNGADLHTLVVVPTGTVTTCTYKLQGSLDNTTWFDISTAALTCTSTVTGFENNKLARYVRGTVVTWAGTGSVSATYMGANRR